MIKKEVKSQALGCKSFILYPAEPGEGFTLIEVLVGTALVLVIFLGTFGVYQLGLKTLGISKNRITATAIANGELEKIRNLPYFLIGTEGAELPYAQGDLPATQIVEKNDTEFTIDIKIKYVSDDADGIGEEDECNLDYKKAEVEVSWPGQFSGEVVLTSDVAPKNTVEEINSCEEQPGGVLLVRTLYCCGEWEESRGAPLIEIFDPETGEKIDSAEPPDGKYNFPLAPSTYKIKVSKQGYSSEETFGSGDSYGEKVIIVPEKSHRTVIEGKKEETSFYIDKVGSFSVDTLSPWGTDNFSDTFSNESGISEKNNITVYEGEARLSVEEGGGYYSSGDLTSVIISDENLLQWEDFSFSDSEPENTDLKYQVLYLSEEDWALVPDAVLPGNSAGFDDSPVDLSGLSPSSYPQLKTKANFSTSDSSFTSFLYDWEISWINSEPTPIPNAGFDLRINKTVGLDAGEDPIYKYFENHVSGYDGHINIPGLEWGEYTFSAGAESGLILTDIIPSPQPVSLTPDNNLEVELYMESENSVLVAVQNEETLEPVFSAAVRLHNSGLDYDVTQYTNADGQTYFIPLSPATYNLEVSAAGYEEDAITVEVSGNTTETIKITQVE